MSAISETYNRTHNILELANILPNVSFKTSETNMITANKYGKYELTNELPNNVRLKKILKLNGIIVYCPVFFLQ